MEIEPLGQLADELEATPGVAAVLPKEPLAAHTLLKVGGPADLLAIVETVQALCRSVTLSWHFGVRCRVLGSGANILASDAGFRGLIVLNRARHVTFCGDTVHAESGALLASVARECVERGLAGLEWASGIPGTIGGAVVGNAGAWGGDVASALLSATLLQADETVEEWTSEHFEFAYRSSSLKRQRPAGPHPLVLAARFGLRVGDRTALRARVAEIQERRRRTQPPGASCGSVFKNPPGDYAGRLIEAAGLKGLRRGGAQISAVHANFVINQGGATASDVKWLIDQAANAVREQAGITLESEVELLGEW